ncbi:hypothetical protein J3459_022527 [Metarhizium acridum]|nr:hypothetical protein J3459_022527 [Metarhizium acridum]
MASFPASRPVNTKGFDYTKDEEKKRGIESVQYGARCLRKCFPVVPDHLPRGSPTQLDPWSLNTRHSWRLRHVYMPGKPILPKFSVSGSAGTVKPDGNLARYPMPTSLARAGFYFYVLPCPCHGIFVNASRFTRRKIRLCSKMHRQQVALRGQGTRQREALFGICTTTTTPHMMSDGRRAPLEGEAEGNGGGGDFAITESHLCTRHRTQTNCAHSM